MKTYIKPEIKCIKIECEDMIAATIEISRTPATGDANAKRFSDGFDYEDDDIDL